MYTKFGEHQNVDVTKSKETRPSFDTESSFTKPRSVIGSSSSGSVTVESARRTLPLRSAWASCAIVHLERRGSTTVTGAVASSPPRLSSRGGQREQAAP